jgi:hypothetical protein
MCVLEGWRGQRRCVEEPWGVRDGLREDSRRGQRVEAKAHLGHAGGAGHGTAVAAAAAAAGVSRALCRGTFQQGASCSRCRRS